MLDHRHRAQPIFAWAMAKVVRGFTAGKKPGIPDCPSGRQAMPIVSPPPPTELQLLPTIGTSWNTAPHSQMQVGIGGVP
jgi:hypothetical protein